MAPLSCLCFPQCGGLRHIHSHTWVLFFFFFFYMNSGLQQTHWAAPPAFLWKVIISFLTCQIACLAFAALDLLNYLWFPRGCLTWPLKQNSLSLPEGAIRLGSTKMMVLYGSSSESSFYQVEEFSNCSWLAKSFSNHKCLVDLIKCF